MDFYRVQVDVDEKKGKTTLTPSFLVGRSKDLMVRGGSFYAIWDEEAGIWSTDEYDVGRLVDKELRDYAEKNHPGAIIRTMENYNSKAWVNYRTLLRNVSDNFHQLDENLTFANQTVKRSDYVSRRLPYSLEEGECPSWNELVGTLYNTAERRKIEWAIGSIFSGDSKKIQKFFVFYGSPGSGKGTIISIAQKLFEGYCTVFDGKALVSSNNAFATEAFKTNPLVALQHDTDLSRIDDNTLLNSIVSHEDIRMNEKYKPSYTGRVNALLLLGSNKPVKISDAKSGLIRRLIDIHPTNVLIPRNRYDVLMSRIDFELGSIASQCLQVYRTLGKNYYNTYRPTEMMYQTDIIFNFIEFYYEIFEQQNGATLKQVYELYKEYCSATGIEKPLPQYKLREEVRNYFDKFQDKVEINGQLLRSYFAGFTADKFKAPVAEDETTFSLVLDEKISLLDDLLAEMPAQTCKDDGTPSMSWSKVRTVLSDIDTHVQHYVKVPPNHIVIDFDLKGDDGGKALARNLEAASQWPPTYAELSKSGEGVHLHYDYDGDVSQLSRLFAEGIEIKVYSGNASLRRRLSRCNSVPVATISSGLPLKEKPKVLAQSTIRSEQGLRALIARNLKKEIHPGTKPSIDFIKKILDEAYSQGLEYDVTDLRGPLLAFANNSTNQSVVCLRTVQQMRFTGQAVRHNDDVVNPLIRNEDPIVFYDVEVYPNLFMICWKYRGSDTVVRMINPTAAEVEGLFRMKLVGFNNRRYDNHILWAAMLGYDNARLYELSQRIMDKKVNAMFAQAYDLSYADVLDFSSVKQSLKKFQIELGLNHQEMDIPWDQPVPKELWPKVEEYCVNDVVTLEQVFEAREQDFVARQILAELSGLTVNHTTANHTAAIIFEGDRNAQSQFVYTDLSKEFPGYTFELGKSTYRGEVVGEGGYVYAEPGMYDDVALLDVASMHPTSIIRLNMFGDRYTANFKALMDARLAIKHRDFDGARAMLGGKLAPYIKNEAAAKDLSYALKIVINTVYGLTSATFDSPFRDKRNKDNIAAKRGALFMIDLKHAVQERGLTAAHIKTDSIKIPGATQEDIDFVFNFGEKYGYTFEHESTYEKFVLVNDAVYVARTGPAEKAEWTAVGAQFKHPYVFKTLFTGEPILDKDVAETRNVVKGHIVLDLPSGRQFIGRIGRFVPVEKDTGVGGTLLVIRDGKETAVAGTKGYDWIEAPHLGDKEIAFDYFENLVKNAKATIEKFGSFEEFVA